MGCKLSVTTAIAHQGEKASLIFAGKEITAYFTSNMRRRYSFNELQAATEKFDPEGFLGGGGFGGVFKGWIHEQTFAPSKPGKGIPIAVKLLDFHGLQGHKEWMAEMYYLGHLQHPNIIKLIGYCSEDDQRLLVYEFMPGGSLDFRLFYDGGEALSWGLRMKIALGAAKGLAYLHTQIIGVIFRDFKPSNILLDLECNVKLSDFGLAMDGPKEEESYVSGRVMGTFGYADPNYIQSGHLTSKSDVYSFGVVLLEILSGRPVIDEDRPEKEHNLVTWARPYLYNNRKLFKVMDPRIQGRYSLTQVLKVANIATRCLSIKPELRPSMDEVVSELEQLQDSLPTLDQFHIWIPKNV